MTKKCRICEEEKVSTEFHLHKANSDGLRAECKECRKTRDKRWMGKGAVISRYNQQYGINQSIMTYAFKEGDEIVYVGSTNHGGFRIWEHYNKNTIASFARHESPLLRQMKYTFHIVWYGDSKDDAFHHEKLWIQIHQPKFNKLKFNNYVG